MQNIAVNNFVFFLPGEIFDRDMSDVFKQIPSDSPVKTFGWRTKTPVELFAKVQWTRKMHAWLTLTESGVSRGRNHPPPDQ